ncbi:hypothetical protein ATOP_18500 [Granulimonas faecalis]|uniref:Uncharacterized protein n=2 Tax=Granulimonas faecalis TaxID=2894155 RepID=A0AAV5B3P8_9ACTN|nr:hypothetical protein ATOP_18500 [Granulimonas faecalis]
MIAMFAVISVIDEDCTERVCLCDSECRAYDIAHHMSVLEGVPCKVVRTPSPWGAARKAKEAIRGHLDRGVSGGGAVGGLA